MQLYPAEHNTNVFYTGLKTWFVASCTAMTPTRSTDDALVTTKSDIVGRLSQSKWSRWLSRTLPLSLPVDDPSTYR